MAEDMIWFHGKINREQARHILSSAERRREGLFLVRETPNHPGTFVLSLWANGQDKHYQIQHHGDAHFAIDDGPVFQGVDDLIRHYKKKSDGLPTRLVEFCPGTYPPPAIRTRCETELHKRAYEGQVQVVRRLLGESVGDLNGKNASGATPLHVAASRGHEDVVLALIQHGADVRLRDNNGTTPLQV
jgi:tyrosine-protein kinase